ncbi:NRDE family protein [Dechloromonas sp. XY25]|uniref:NRDE family protein n=1 Tax=Dechloromonas hankyongensis TaxID=2908002 RepID=A0ABS9K3E7_9RHOO|nr:NRDE family protein [Dechloromonas hankyongensis]MCG2577683.1 NRDE family protein [Dechloromonas hankyongensis]
MCLIVVGWRVHPDYPLVVAANRDEFYARPSTAIGRWADAPHVIGGLDLEAGGTWLGITDSGRFAAVTNVRESGAAKGALSRGALTRNFLTSRLSAGEYAAQLDYAQYSGFNLLLADGAALTYCTNRDGTPRSLAPGVYGLSNHLLDSPWPKLLAARLRFSAALPRLPDTRAFFDLLADREIVPDAELPSTGVSLEWERLLSAIFVKSESYGTRASTVAWLRRDGEVTMHEKSFGPGGQALQSSAISTAE